MQTLVSIQISLFNFNVCNNGYKYDLAHIFLMYKGQLLILLQVHISCTCYQLTGHCHTSMFYTLSVPLFYSTLLFLPILSSLYSRSNSIFKEYIPT